MKRILVIALGVLMLAGMAAAQVPVTYPTTQPGNVLEFLLNRAIDSPPYTKGTYGSSTSGLGFTFAFRTIHAKIGYWCYSYIMLPAANATAVNVKYCLNDTVVRVINMAPGGAIADYVACDSVIVTKTTAADVVNYGAYYNR